MKIAEISPFFPPFPGGLEVHCKITCDYLSNLNTNQIFIFTTDYPKILGQYRLERKSNVKINRLPLTFKLYNNPFCINLFFKLFKENLDIFHVQGYWSFFNVFSALVCLIKRKPMVVTFHGYQEGIVERYGLIGQLVLIIYLKLASWLFKRVIKAITCNHDRDRNILIQMGFNPSIIHIIPSGIQVNTGKFKPETISAFKKNHGIMTNNVILFVGRLIRRKGANHLVELANEINKKIDDFMLLIIGDGELRNYLESEIEKKN